jgi:hypothetical protein
MSHSLSEPLDVNGMWWLPEHPDEEAYGSLHFDSESGAQLHLKSVPAGFRQLTEAKTGSAGATIHGRQLLGRPITLLGCFALHWPLGPGGPPELTLRANSIWIGLHSADPKAETFAGTRFSTRLLSDWCLAFSGHPTLDVPDGESSRAESHYEVPSDVEIELPGATAALTLEVTFSNALRSAGIDEQPRVLIRSHEPMTIDELLRTYVDALRDFLSLAADRPDQLTCCSLELLVGDAEAERPWPVDVVFSPAGKRDDRGSFADFLFTFADVRDRLGPLWSDWIALRERLRLPIVLFFGTVYAPFLYPETRLVQLVQALESLDRQLHRGTPTDPDFVAWRARVAGQLSSEDAERLLRELDVRKGATLRRRLERMLSESVLPETVVADAKAFAHLVADTRHYWTHGSETRFVEHDSARLYWSGVVLQYLFKEELLTALGFEPEARKKMFRSSRRFQAIPTDLF